MIEIVREALAVVVKRWTPLLFSCRILLLKNVAAAAQQRVMKLPKMDMANRTRTAFDPYSGAIAIVRMAQSPQMRKPLEWRRHERPMQPHNEVERSQE